MDMMTPWLTTTAGLRRLNFPNSAEKKLETMMPELNERGDIRTINTKNEFGQIRGKQYFHKEYIPDEYLLESMVMRQILERTAAQVGNVLHGTKTLAVDETGDWCLFKDFPLMSIIRGRVCGIGLKILRCGKRYRLLP